MKVMRAEADNGADQPLVKCALVTVCRDSARKHKLLWGICGQHQQLGGKKTAFIILRPTN